MIVLGISGGFGHDSASCLVRDGHIIAIAEEERFVRIKHALNMPPINASLYCLAQAGISIEEVDIIAVSWNPNRDPASQELRRSVDRFVAHETWRGKILPPLEYVDHHLAHAAASFFCSGFKESAVLIVDGNGEDVSTSLGYARDRTIQFTRQFGFTNSLGQFYKVASEYLGLGSHGEGKLMGLAAYGKPSFHISAVKLENDGYQIDLPNVDTLPADQRSTMLRRAWRKWFENTLGSPFVVRHEWLKDSGETEKFLDIDRRCMDVAASVQLTLSETMVHLARVAVETTGCRNLVMGGGAALNCGANGRILHSGLVSSCPRNHFST